MPKDTSLKKIMVIGSGPIIIGQAAEFDYAGTQACRALKEEGLEVILINSNPATIMTDDDIADKVYIQPLTLEAAEYIIERERPCGLLATLGGQTGLNLASELHKEGILQKYNVKLLGTSIEAIQNAEDRECFKALMQDINEPVAKSKIISEIQEGIDFANKIGYPIVVRPAFTLGGTGGGIAYNEKELREQLYQGLLHSPINQVLLEVSLLGWKEIEYEVMRDSNDTCITVCNMENFDPVGVHTGDSIVVAPSQTLSDKEYQMLRSASLKIIRALKIKGGCNVQFALNPDNGKYVVIEVNPRVSRSSALASKATGYPIAKVTAKIALGMHLHEIENYVTKKTKCSFEPAIDYIVTKIPKWPFDKFPYIDRTLSTQMKATGEVMAIGRTFESSFLKALICLEAKKTGLRSEKIMALQTPDLLNKIKIPNDKRVYAIAEAFRRNISIDEIHDITKITKWFLSKIKNIIDIEKRLQNEPLTHELLHKAESTGFMDEEICFLTKQPLEILDTMRRSYDIYPVYKMVDTCAAEFEAKTPYYYSTYETEDENIISSKEKIIVIGSGPIRIGQGIEFDYCSVHAIQAIKDQGFEAIIINNNPETVSTDFDIADKLYFEPLHADDVCNIIRKEVPRGVIIQFGGQTALNLSNKLLTRGVQVLGTSVESIDVAEDRKRFEMLLRALDIKQPKSIAVTDIQEALKAAKEIGYPILTRPSYITGGRAMKVLYSEEELLSYIEEAISISPKYPVSIDQYIQGQEVEIDLISDGHDILIPGIMEHVERTGVHSGDSFFVYPHRKISDAIVDKIVNYSKKIAKALQIVGLMNIQFIVKDNELYVIEVNPRASRTIPIMSKVKQIPMVKIAIDVILGQKLKDKGYGVGLMPKTQLIAVKAPVFSFHKLTDVDMALGAEMKSTGEVLGIDTSYEKALIKAFMAAGVSFEDSGKILISLNKKDLQEGLNLVKRIQKMGFSILATEGNADFLTKNNVKNTSLNKNKLDLIREKIKNKKIKLILNTPTKGGNAKTAGFNIRSLSTQYNVPCFTCLDTFDIYLKALEYYKETHKPDYKTINEYACTQSNNKAFLNIT